MVRAVCTKLEASVPMVMVTIIMNSMIISCYWFPNLT